MDNWKRGLTIQGHRFDYKELLVFCSNNIVSIHTNPWEKEIYRFIITWLSDSDHIIQYSSGTTGRPKEIKLSKQSMMISALNTCSYFGLKKGDNVLLCMPVDYIAGKMMVVRSFVGELNLQMTEPRSIPEISMGSTIDFCAMVPLQVLNLLACIKDLHPIHKLLIGGAEISNELEKLLLPITTEVFASYGMAETSSHVAIRRLNGPQRQKYYTALPGIKLSLDDRGCLVINASYLPGPVVSNDLVELTAPDSFIWIGRFDNLINSGGIKIAPEEVESLILSKTMLECVAVGLPNKKLGQKLVFVFEQDQIPDSFSDLKSDLDSFLPRHWRPKDLIVVSKFPRNESFKVDRRKLTAMLSE